MISKREDTTFEFISDGESDSAMDQERLDILAVCIAHQQRAGFKSRLDTRETHCADCGASGFNTGWGFWQFSCGLTILSDGTPDDPCEADVKAENPNA